MQSNIYQPPVQPVTPVEDKPPAFTPYTKWTSFTELVKKHILQHNQIECLEMWLVVIQQVVSQFIQEKQNTIPWYNGHYSNPVKYVYGTRPINF